MAKKKKRTASTKRKKPTFELKVKKSVLREIYGVFYVALGFFTLLSLYKKFGVVGDYWLSFIAPVFGWGIYVVPIILFVIALYYFLAKQVSFQFSRLLGMLMIVVSGLSILHLSVPMDGIFSKAQAAEYGGYIGFVTNFLFLEVFKIGAVGSAVVFITTLIVGVLLTFEISIIQVLKFLKPDIRLVRLNVRDDEETEDEEEKTEKIVKRIDDMPDSDFGMPTEYEHEPTLKIRRMAGAKDLISSEADEHLPAELVSFEKTPIAKDQNEKVKQIKIKDENEEAVTASDAGIGGTTWTAPSLDLLAPAVPDVAHDDDLLSDNAAKIKAKLEQFGIDVTMLDQRLYNIH